jgi:hypothetical protein
LFGINAIGKQARFDITNRSAELSVFNILHLVVKLSDLHPFFQLVLDVLAFLHLLPIFLLDCIEFNSNEIWHFWSTMSASEYYLFYFNIDSWITT